MKRVLTILLALSLFVFISSGVFAITCTIENSARSGDQTDYELMRISDVTNAHGATTENPLGYKYVYCSVTGGNVACLADGSNKVLGLSSIANAHAEIPSLNNYATDVCYADWSCTTTQTTCPSGKDAILSLSSDTNAHIGPATGTGSYPTKICCASLSSTSVPSAFWLSFDGDEITETDEIDVDPGTTQVHAVLENSGLAQDTSVSFKIYEDDPIFDDLVFEGTSKTNAYGDADKIWTIESADLTNDANSVFYFEAYQGSNLIATSGKLNIGEVVPGFCDGKSVCGDYNTIIYCGDETNIGDTCGLAANSVPGGVVCSLETGGYDCSCGWVGSSSQCDVFYGPRSDSLWCGDSSINTYTLNGKERIEQCDPDTNIPVFNAGENDCTAYDSYTGGTLGCYREGSQQCRFDYSPCDGGTETCGDGIINQITEECDTNDFGVSGNLCSNQGFASGIMTCNAATCKLVKTACQNPLSGGACGDGNVQSSERCDSGLDGTGTAGLSGKSCLIVSGNFYNGGTLSCSGFCSYDVSLCKIGETLVKDYTGNLCGSRIVDSMNEECDGEDFGVFGNSCSALGFKDDGSTVSCVNCRGDTNSCVIPLKSGVSLGKCQITPTGAADTCEGDNQISYSWTAAWVGNPTTLSCITSADCSSPLICGQVSLTAPKVCQPASCKEGSKVLVCPAQIQLPFFETINFMITALAIAFIYAVLILRRKK